MSNTRARGAPPISSIIGVRSPWSKGLMVSVVHKTVPFCISMVTGFPKNIGNKIALCPCLVPFNYQRHHCQPFLESGTFRALFWKVVRDTIFS